MGLPGQEKFDGIFSRFDQYMSVMDRWTDRHRTTAGTPLCISWRGK